MKRFILAVLAIMLTLSAAADVDLSGLTFEELAELRDRAQMEMMARGEWQEVTVPAGVWEIGKDIPAGHWVIRPIPDTYILVTYCDRLDEFGKGVGTGWRGWHDTLTSRTKGMTVNEPREADLEMVEGMYFINSGACIFTPYTGKPDLGFK